MLPPEGKIYAGLLLRLGLTVRSGTRQKAIKGDLPAQALQVRPFHLRPRQQPGF